VPGTAPGQMLTLALRPEKIAISRARPEGPNAFEGTVDDLGYFGKDSLYKVKLASGKVLSVLSVNARRADEKQRVAAWEDRVWLSFEPGAAILLTH